MKVAGLVLIILGVVALVYQGFTYTKKEEVAQIGSLKITADNDKKVTIPPYVGAGLVLGGAAVLYFGSRGR